MQMEDAQVLLRRAEVGDAPQCDCVVCAALQRRSHRLVPYRPVGTCPPDWLLDWMAERPTPRTLLVVCVLLVVLGWGMLAAAEVYASYSHDPVTVGAGPVFAPVLMTLGILLTAAYTPPLTFRQERLEQRADEAALPSVFQTEDEVRLARREDWMRNASLILGALMFGVGAFLGILYALVKWLAPPVSARPQPTTSTPGVCLLMMDLLFLFAVAMRYLAVQAAAQEREDHLVQVAAVKESEGHL